jgi:hypothetical protein
VTDAPAQNGILTQGKQNLDDVIGGNAGKGHGLLACTGRWLYDNKNPPETISGGFVSSEFIPNASA